MSKSSHITAQVDADIKQICKNEGKTSLEVTSANKWAVIKRAVDALAGKVSDASIIWT